MMVDLSGGEARIGESPRIVRQGCIARILGRFPGAGRRASITAGPPGPRRILRAWERFATIGIVRGDSPLGAGGVAARRARGSTRERLGPHFRPILLCPKEAPAMIDPRVASGLRDIPPSVMILRERMLAAFRATFASFGYVPIETPHIERMEVLTGKGAGSDEVLRQIFEVINKGGKEGKLALRFDLTVPLARFVAKHVNELGVPFKRYAIGSVFRGERPAKGRFREFVQCDFDTVGTEGVVADAETAQVIHDALDAAGVPEFTITLNNRKVLDGLLDTLGIADKTGPVLRALDKLAKIGREKVLGELRRGEPGEAEGESSGRSSRLTEDQARQVLDFVEQGRGGFEVLDPVQERLGGQSRAAEGIASLRTILALLDAAGVRGHRLAIDLGLARGL